MSKAVPIPRQWEPKPFLRADQPMMVYSSLDTLELVMVHSGGESREIDGAVAGIRRTGRMEGIIGTESRQNDNTRECRE